MTLQTKQPGITRLLTHSLSASSQPIETYRKVAPEKPLVKPTVVSFDSYFYDSVETAPSGYKTPAEMHDKWSKDPARAERMAAARKRLVKMLSDEGECDLRALRLQRGLSQTDLARLTKTSQPQIARIESGRGNVMLSSARSLADALNCSLDEVNAALLVSEQKAQDRG